MRRYLYRGRHRKPSIARRQAAALTVAGATVGLGMTQGQAHASDRWDALIQCESGGDEDAQNPRSSASGLFQFIDSTWRAYGGLEFGKRAKDATAEEQYEVANRAFADEGYGPWTASRHCWSGKVDGGGRAVPEKAEPAAEQTAAVPTVEQYTVRPGDTLSRIAGPGWLALYERNRGVIGDNPNLIHPGQVLDL